MATQILAVGDTPDSSADITLDVGEQITVSLNDDAGPRVHRDARVGVDLKDANNRYFRIDMLTENDPARVVVGPGTYRFTRLGNASCGVFRA